MGRGSKIGKILWNFFTDCPYQNITFKNITFLFLAVNYYPEKVDSTVAFDSHEQLGKYYIYIARGSSDSVLGTIHTGRLQNFTVFNPPRTPSCVRIFWPFTGRN